MIEGFAGADSLLERGRTNLEEMLVSIGKRRRTYLGKLIILYAAVRLFRPQVVVETGVDDGFSTYSILTALKRNGTGVLHSIDLGRLTNVEGLATGHLVPDELKPRWNLHVGDSRAELPKVLEEAGKTDFFYQDDNGQDYELQAFEYRACWDHLRPCGVLFSACVAFNTSLGDLARKVGGTLALPESIVPVRYPPIANWGLVQRAAVVHSSP